MSSRDVVAGTTPRSSSSAYRLTAVLGIAGSAICLAGSGAGTTLEGGSTFVGAGLSVLALNRLFRYGTSGDVERDAKEAARRYLDGPITGRVVTSIGDRSRRQEKRLSGSKQSFSAAEGLVSDAGSRERNRRRADREALGRAIRRLRKERGMTLADVSAVAGLSVSLLSQIERARTDPSLDSLRDIAEALGTAPFKLLAAQSHEFSLVRFGEGRRLSLPDTDVEVELLSPSMEGPFEVIRWTLAVGGVTARAPRSHEGVETTILLTGEVRISVATTS